MYKIAFLTLALCSAVLAETTFKKVPFIARATYLPKPGDVVNHLAAGKAAESFTIPPDNGGNYGDRFWGSRLGRDTLLSREVHINEISSSEQAFKWFGDFPGHSFTHIRFLNFGRERAFVDYVSVVESKGNATILIGANQQFRFMIEVYGV